MSKRKLEIEQRLQSYSRRLFLQRASLLGGMIALGGGSYLYNPKGSWAADPIKVGIATDLTGPISWGGIPNANVARMVIDDMNASGGLLGRPLQIVLEDTATNEALAVTKVRKLVTQDKVDVVLGALQARCATPSRTPSSIAARPCTSITRSCTKARVHALPVLHRPHAGAAMRHLHPVADQKRRQEILSALGRLRVAARAQRSTRARSSRRTAARWWGKNISRSTTTNTALP